MRLRMIVTVIGPGYAYPAGDIVEVEDSDLVTALLFKGHAEPAWLHEHETPDMNPPEIR